MDYGVNGRVLSVYLKMSEKFAGRFPSAGDRVSFAVDHNDVFRSEERLENPGRSDLEKTVRCAYAYVSLSSNGIISVICEFRKKDYFFSRSHGCLRKNSD
jgi:hypothetical protein